MIRKILFSVIREVAAPPLGQARLPVLDRSAGQLNATVKSLNLRSVSLRPPEYGGLVSGSGSSSLPWGITIYHRGT